MRNNRKDIETEIISEIKKEKIFTFDTRNPGSSIDWRNKKLLIYINQGSIPLFMKIPTGNADTREVERTYAVHNLMDGDDEFLEPIIGDKPHTYVYTDRGQRVKGQAIVIAQASMDLEDYFKDFDKISNEMRDKNLFEVILSASYGLQKVHKKGIIHKDVKESNIMMYPDWWGIGDFGSCSIFGNVRNNNFSTHTINKNFEYLTYELIENLTRETNNSDNNEAKYFINNSVDIFSLGVVYYKGLNKKQNLSPYAEWHDGPDRTAGFGYNPEFMLKLIESKKEFTNKAKYFLRRMLGPAASDTIIGIERSNYRYNNIDELVSDAYSWNSNTNRPTAGRIVTDNFKYKPFLKDVDKFRVVMNRERTILDAKKMITDKSIETIVKSYLALEKKYDDTEINTFSEAQNAYKEVVTEYMSMVSREGNIIEDLTKEITTRNVVNTSDIHKVAQDFIRLCEKTGLWGPPLSAYRYTLDQTSKKETHYHNDPIIAGWLKA